MKGGQDISGLPTQKEHDIHMQTNKGFPAFDVHMNTAKGYTMGADDVYMDTARGTLKPGGFQLWERELLDSPEVKRKSTVAQLCESLIYMLYPPPARRCTPSSNRSPACS